MPKTIAIDQTTILNGQDAADFFEFISKNKQEGLSYFSAGFCPVFKGNTIRFKQAFLCENGDQTGTFTAAFIGKPLGGGSFGVVYHIDKQVKFTEDNFIPSEAMRPQVLKIQQHCRCLAAKQDDCSKHNPLASLMNEISMARKTLHLNPHAPVIEHKHTIRSFTLDNEMPGCELFDIIKLDLDQKLILTLYQRIRLSVVVLEAVFNQVTMHNLIHRDLKPENIKVVLEEPMIANIVDFGFAVEIPAGMSAISDSRFCGSISYVAPEMYRIKVAPMLMAPQTPALDLFAVGRILYLIWGGIDATYTDSFETSQWLHVKEHYLSGLTTLFDGLPEGQLLDLIAFDLDDKIKCLFAQMLTAKPEKRIPIERALEQFRNFQRVVLDTYASKDSEIRQTPEVLPVSEISPVSDASGTSEASQSPARLPGMGRAFRFFASKTRHPNSAGRLPPRASFERAFESIHETPV